MKIIHVLAICCFVIAFTYCFGECETKEKEPADFESKVFKSIRDHSGTGGYYLSKKQIEFSEICDILLVNRYY